MEAADRKETAADPGVRQRANAADAASTRRDVFVSYSRTDRPRVAPLVAEFEARGMRVWWDERLRAGDEFDARIERALADARAAVVIFTESSVRSRWVLSEATRAWEQDKLFPVLLDEVPVPLPFNRVHATRLVGWPSTRDDKELLRLLESIGGDGPLPLPPPPPPPVWPRVVTAAIAAFGSVFVKMALFPFAPVLSGSSLLFGCLALAGIVLALTPLPPTVKHRVDRTLFDSNNRPRLPSLAAGVLFLAALAALAYFERPSITIARVRGELPPDGASSRAWTVNMDNPHGGEVLPADGHLLVTLDTGLARAATDVELKATLQPYGYVEFAEFASEKTLGFTQQMGSLPSVDGKGSITIESPSVRGRARVGIRWKRPPEKRPGIPAPLLKVEWRVGDWSKHVTYPLEDR